MRLTPRRPGLTIFERYGFKPYQANANANAG
jgi:hypothetical protein